jgi:hypothetical protein
MDDCINQCEDFLAQIDDQCAVMMHEYPFWAHVLEMDRHNEKCSIGDEKRSTNDEKSDSEEKSKEWLEKKDRIFALIGVCSLEDPKHSIVPNFRDDDIIMYRLLLSVRAHILKLKHKIFQMTKPGDVLRTMAEQLKIKADLFHKKIKESDEYNKEIHLDFFEIRTRVWLLDARARFLGLICK